MNHLKTDCSVRHSQGDCEKKKMRVLMVGPDSLGGISSVIRTLLPVLRQRLDILHLPTVKGRSPKEAGKLSVKNIGLAISQYGRFLHALVRFRPTIIHLHTSQGVGWLKDTFFVLVAKALRYRVVLHVHAASFDAFYGKNSWYYRAYTRQVMQLAEVVLSVSPQWQTLMSQIIPKRRVLSFTNCIDVSTIQPHRMESINPPREVGVLFLGAVGRRKGVPELIEAMGRLKSRGCPLHLWIAGPEENEGDYDRVRAQIRQLNLGAACELLGDVREQRKANLLEEARLFALPSHNEGLPIALLEAMAAGLAIVATPVGGIPEVIQDGYNGLLVAPGNVEALADQLAVLASDRRLFELMGLRNREIAERNLDVKPYVERLMRLYESIVSKRQPLMS